MRLIRLADRPDLDVAALAATAAAWPAFMMESPVADRHWGPMTRLFADFNLALIAGDDTILAIGNAVPFVWDPAAPLPASGWDWVFTQALATAGERPTLASALAITIPPVYRGAGHARRLLTAFKAAARAHGCQALVAPVRPTRKAEFPDQAMADYLNRRDDQGRRFDPWVGLHESMGATILSIADQSMVIPGTRDQWRQWTGLEPPTAGRWTVPGALQPVVINGDTITYTEPNVWMRHAL